MKKILKPMTLVFAVLFVNACSQKCFQCETESLQVNLEPRSNSQVIGTLLLREDATTKSLHIQGEVRNLTPGKHGFHVHEFGDCSAADASSAGGHFGHSQEFHAGPLHQRSHAGDLGNIVANSDGLARIDIKSEKLCLSDPRCSILGRSFVVHAEADDLRSQPSGASGARQACGTIAQKNCCQK